MEKKHNASVADLIEYLKNLNGPVPDGDLEWFNRYAPWYETAKIGDPVHYPWNAALKGDIAEAIKFIELKLPGWEWTLKPKWAMIKQWDQVYSSVCLSGTSHALLVVYLLYLLDNESK